MKYDIEIRDEAVAATLKKLTNQIYKLLPVREEQGDWKLPLITLVEEIGGMSNLLLGQQENLFALLCKMEGLLFLTEEDDFFLYRRTIFECLGIINQIRASCLSQTN